MEPPANLIDRRLLGSFLAGPEAAYFGALVLSYVERLRGLKNRSEPYRIFIAERDPVCFTAAFLAATKERRTGEIFLCSPDWGRREWEQVFALAKPDLHFGPDPGGSPRRLTGESPVPSRFSVMIPTGGTGGALRFARHDWHSLSSAAIGLRDCLRTGPMHSVCLLPMFHVSGLMPLIRTLVCGGRFLPWSSRAIEAQSVPELPRGECFLSLVPTQLQRFLELPTVIAWMRRFACIFVGGGPCWPDVLERAASHGLPISLVYGMTETAAQITALKPAEFLQGRRDCGRSLGHAQVIVLSEHSDEPVPQGSIGRISVRGSSLYRGYFPDALEIREVITDDLGWVDREGHLHILGRRNEVIFTGGEKVHPAEVEAALHNTGAFREVAVLGIPDTDWGERVTVCYQPATQEPIDFDRLNIDLRASLSPHKIPKQWIQLSAWPVNPQGKLNRAELRAQAEATRKT